MALCNVICIKVSVTRTFKHAGYQQSFTLFFFAQLKLAQIQFLHNFGSNEEIG